MFDIIGDVHGQYHRLLALLKHLGYSDTAGAWRHAGRTAIFVGDLIDRGPKQISTLDVVRRMVEAGTARCVMGNHEFNAIAWFTPDPDRPGEFLRPHGTAGNYDQHAAFLSEVADSPHHAQWIDWFKTLPLWLDLGGIRVVHACWDDPSMDRLRPVLSADHTLTDEAIVLGNKPGHPAFHAIETLCKGLEIPLPEGISYRDEGGRRRTQTRIRWWERDLSTFRKAAVGPPSFVERIPDIAMPADFQVRAYDGPPVVFGHYWFTGELRVLARNLACVDYSVCNGGPLAAYRWDGEAELSSKKMVGV